MRELSQQQIADLFYFDAQSGRLWWRNTRQDFMSRPAGQSDRLGYTRIRVNGRLYRAHHLVWVLAHGVWPSGFIDHINGDPADNRVSNLRQANKSENGQNRTQRTSNLCGYLGVSYCKNKKKYSARLTINRKTHILGFFDAPDEAYQAYLRGKSQLHNFQPTPRNDYSRVTGTTA